MGRVSKRGNALRKNADIQTERNVEKKRYQAGIYARLSSDQGSGIGGQDGRNESLEGQIGIARKFAEEWNRNKTGEVIDIVECYTDLGKTGSNFERAGFRRLLQDIRLGRINCVIVKDLSRFGRNYLEAGNYIEKIFPFLGVRFIAVADGLDTGKEDNANGQISSAMTVEIKNLVNDMYAKDFSKKAKLHLKQRRAEGSYVGGPPPYGYIAEWNGKRRILIPDENTAGIVRFIYEKFVETESYTAVADALNHRQYHPPALYQKTGRVSYFPKDDQTPDAGAYQGWDKGAVQRILKSETYIGTLVQGKTGITARNEKNRVSKPEKEWVVIKDAHEPLIDRELYQRSVEIREKIRKRTASAHPPAKDAPVTETIFDRVLYCGVCGRKMTRNSYVRQDADGTKARLEEYVCLHGGQTKATLCPNANRISENELVKLLLPMIRMELAVFSDNLENNIENGKKSIAGAVKQAKARLQEAEGKLRRFYEEEGSIYMNYRAGKISQKEYVFLKKQQEKKLADFQKQREGQEKEIAEAFISKISIYPEKRMEILFTFTADGMGVPSEAVCTSKKKNKNEEGVK